MAESCTAPLGWGVIGCGDVVEHKSGPSITAAERSRMLIAMRRDAAAARDFARRHAVAEWTDDAGAVIGNGNVDVVYVATPPSSPLAVRPRGRGGGQARPGREADGAERG